MTTVSPFILILLPFIASAITGIMQHNEYTKAQNAIIATVFFFTATIICWYLKDAIPNDPKNDFVIILSFLFNNVACKDLNQALVEAVPSPLLLLRRKEGKGKG